MRCHSLARLLLYPELVHHKLCSLFEIPALISSVLAFHNTLQVPGELALVGKATVELLDPILFPEVTWLTKPGPFQPPSDEVHVIPSNGETVAPIGDLLPWRNDPAVLVLQELRDVFVDPAMPSHERMELVNPCLGQQFQEQQRFWALVIPDQWLSNAPVVLPSLPEVFPALRGSIPFGFRQPTEYFPLSG